MYFLIFDKKFRGGIPEDPVFGTRYYLCFFYFFFDGSTWYQIRGLPVFKKNSSGNSGIRLLVIAPKNDP
jgi:hypothetical protein